MRITAFEYNLRVAERRNREEYDGQIDWDDVVDAALDGCVQAKVCPLMPMVVRGFSMDCEHWEV